MKNANYFKAFLYQVDYCIAPSFYKVMCIFGAFSDRLLDSLTRALQSSGVDLAKASISVQIDLGKPSGSALKSSTEVQLCNQVFYSSIYDCCKEFVSLTKF